MKLALFLVALTVSLCQAQNTEIVPSLATLVATYRANGTLQINCTSASTVSGPLNINSVLTDANNTPVGTYTGPFNNNDGSSTRVVVPNIQSTAVPNSLASFLGVAQRVDGNRIFDRIVFITRYNTSGGVIDPATCANNVGNLTTVPFQATYGFYRSIPPTVTGTLRNTFRANGTLQLTCTNGAYSAPAGINSVLSTVDAATTAVGSYNGSFISNDGSATRTSGTPTSTNNAFGNALPSFLASAVTVPGTRTFDNIGQITRYDTVGGVATSTDPACTTSNEGFVLTKAFQATYGFYDAAAGTATTSTTVASPSTSPSTTTTATRNAAGSVAVSMMVVIGLVLFAV